MVSFPRHTPDPPGALVIWVIFGPTTTDFPGQYVIRRQVARQRRVEIDPKLSGRADTLEEVRSLLPYGLTRLPPDPQDHPTIVECWL